MRKLKWQKKPVRFHAAQKTPQQWNQYQGIINTLHADGRTQKQIREILENNYGFTISIGQLRKRLLQAPPRNTASVSSSLPKSRSRFPAGKSRRPVGKSRQKPVVPQRVFKATASSAPSASPSSPFHHVPNPPICHLDRSSVELSRTEASLPNSEEEELRLLTTILDEGSDVSSNPEEVSTIVGTGGFEPDQQQASQINIPAPELPDTVLIHYQPISQTTANTPHTISNPDSLFADMEVNPSNDLSEKFGSIMPSGWLGTIDSKGEDEYSSDLKAQIRERRACKENATRYTTASGKLRLRRAPRLRTKYVCCVCTKPATFESCKRCRHERCPGCKSRQRG